MNLGVCVAAGRALHARGPSAPFHARRRGGGARAARQWEGHDTWEPVDQLQGSHVKGLINAYNEKLRNLSKS